MNSNKLSSGIKNVADIVKKADNLELYAMLLDLYGKALDLQQENAELKSKLADISEQKSIANKVLRHHQPYITIKDEVPSLMYCAHCWDSQGKLIQINSSPRSAEFFCPDCKNSGVYDEAANAQYERARQGIGVL